MAVRNLKVPLWTLVQHEAFGWKGDPTFEAAVATFGLTTIAAKAKVMEAGGLLFVSYTEASQAEYDVNYPEGEISGNWLVPEAKGIFASQVVGGLHVYVPTIAERERYIDAFSSSVGVTS